MKKRSFVRGVLAAIASHYVVLLCLFLVYWLLRPYGSAIINGTPYRYAPGPIDPNSGEWLILQAIAFLSWIAGGYAACRWDVKNSNGAVLVVVAICMLLVLAGGVPDSAATARKVIFFSEIPVAISLGWCMNRYIDAKSRRLT